MRYNKGRVRKGNAKRLSLGNKGRYKKVRQRLINLDLLSAFPVFNTRKYTSKEYFNAFEAASLNQLSIKQLCLTERVKGRECPSPEQMMKCCRTISPEDMVSFVNAALASYFKALPQNVRQNLKKSGTVIIDFHQDCYYGTKDNPHVRKGRTKKSTNLFYEYITADLFCKHGSFTIALLHRSPNEDIFSLAKRLIEYVENVMKIKVILFDGEFAVIDLLAFLQQKGIKYLGRKSKTQLVKKHAERYYNGSNWSKVRQWREIELRSKRSKSKKVRADICPQSVYGEMKFLIKSSGWSITPRYADKLYGKRFNIETGYRDKHKFEIFTCTKVLSTRLLFFLFAILEWNCWQSFLIWVRSLKSYSKDLPRTLLCQLTLNWIKILTTERLYIESYVSSNGGG